MVDGVDYTYALKDLSFEAGDDAPAHLLEATLGLRLPTEGARSVFRREITLTVYVEGDETTEEFLAFRGKIVEVRSEGRFTYLIAATGGFAVKRSLKRPLEYVNASPALVLFDALSDLPYDGIEIEAAMEDGGDGPGQSLAMITAYGPEAFRPLDKRTDLLSMVRDEARLVAADRPDNVAAAYSEATISGDGSEAASWTIEEGLDCDFGAVAVETSETERYAAVVAYTEMRDGTQIEVARALVDNHGVPVDPDDTLDLLFSYDENEDEAQRADSAFAFCFREALKLSAAPVVLDVPLIYRPHHIVRGDLVTVRTHEFAADTNGAEGAWIRDYLMRVDSLSGGTSKRDGSLSGAAELTAKKFAPLARAGLASPESASVSELWGPDYAGRQFVDLRLPWVSLDGEDLVLDTDVAALYGVTIEDTEGSEVVVTG